MRKLLFLLPFIALLLAFSPAAEARDNRHRRSSHGKRNLNDGYDRYYNSRRGYQRREYQGRRRYYRDGQYYYRSRDGYYPYGYRRNRGGVNITF